MKHVFLTMAIATASMAALGGSLARAEIKSGPYTPDWDSIKQHPGAPEWFLDGKLGIYTHWGPITKANEFRPDHAYGRDMYDPKQDEFEYHVKTHGSQHEVGYKDLTPLFQPVEFDAEVWANLFAEAGARFAGPVAMHHDNFAMWGSEVTPWNIEKTFGRDTCAELEKAIRACGMKFVTSFHHAYSWHYYRYAYDYDAGQPGNESLYCKPHAMDVGQKSSEAAEFCQEWLAKLTEVIDKYQPDFIWFDWGIAAMPEEPVLDFFTHYLNSAAEWNKEVVVTFKKTPKKAFPGDFTVLDHERGGHLELSDKPWVNDTSVGPWFSNAKFAAQGKIETDTLIELFVDLVSKNGCLLLNVPPDPLGRISARSVQVLKELGQWNKVNGEAIFETRPWVVAAEGDGEIQGKMSIASAMTASDIRFTRNKANDTLYAITLDWPEDGKMRVKTLAKGHLDMGSVKTITRIDNGETLEWNQKMDGLEIELGNQPETNFAHAVKIVFEKAIPELQQ